MLLFFDMLRLITVRLASAVPVLLGTFSIAVHAFILTLVVGIVAEVKNFRPFLIPRFSNVHLQT